MGLAARGGASAPIGSEESGDVAGGGRLGPKLKLRHPGSGLVVGGAGLRRGRKQKWRKDAGGEAGAEKMGGYPGTPGLGSLYLSLTRVLGHPLGPAQPSPAPRSGSAGWPVPVK